MTLPVEGVRISPIVPRDFTPVGEAPTARTDDASTPAAPDGFHDEPASASPLSGEHVPNLRGLDGVEERVTTLPPREHLGIQTPLGRFRADSIVERFAKLLTDERVGDATLSRAAVESHVKGHFERAPELLAASANHFRTVAETLAEVLPTVARGQSVNFPGDRVLDRDEILEIIQGLSGELQRERLTVDPTQVGELARSDSDDATLRALEALEAETGAPLEALRALLAEDEAGLASSEPKLADASGVLHTRSQLAAMMSERSGTSSGTPVRNRAGIDAELERILRRAKFRTEDWHILEAYAAFPEISEVESLRGIKKNYLGFVLAGHAVQGIELTREQALDDLATMNRVLTGTTTPEDRAIVLRRTAEKLGIAQNVLDAFLENRLSDIPVRDTVFSEGSKHLTGSAVREISLRRKPWRTKKKRSEAAPSPPTKSGSNSRPRGSSVPGFGHVQCHPAARLSGRKPWKRDDPQPGFDVARGCPDVGSRGRDPPRRRRARRGGNDPFARAGHRQAQANPFDPARRRPQAGGRDHTGRAR